MQWHVKRAAIARARPEVPSSPSPLAFVFREALSGPTEPWDEYGEPWPSHALECTGMRPDRCWICAGEDPSVGTRFHADRCNGCAHCYPTKLHKARCAFVNTDGCRWCDFVQFDGRGDPTAWHVQICTGCDHCDHFGPGAPFAGAPMRESAPGN